jgi:rod shape-determining protein MreC
MPDFLKRLSAPIAFGALILLAAVTMVTDRRDLAEGGGDLPWWQGFLLDIAIPIQKVLAAPVEATGEAWARYVDLVGVEAQNAELRDQIARLEEENLQYREALVASGHLDRIAEMRDEFEMSMLPSEVVGLDVSPSFESVLLDRGRTHGVRSGFPVVTEAGVVGLVTHTSGHAAKTMLVLDRQSAVEGVVQRSRVRGIVRGHGSDDLRFEFLVRGGDVEIGDTVLTSGLGGVYPKGLRIGSVVEVEEAGGQLLQIAKVKPSVDFGRLEQVFVMLRHGPTFELLNARRGAEPRDLFDADAEDTDPALATEADAAGEAPAS